MGTTKPPPTPAHTIDAEAMTQHQPRRNGRVRHYLASFTGFERDARVFLLASLVGGVTLSLYWVDFNLYLAALGFDGASIGLIATASSAAQAVVAFPASLASDRLGRRAILLGGAVVSAAATLGFLATSEPLLLATFAAMFGAATQAVFVVQVPFMTEHSRREHRSELFAAQFAIANATNVGAALLGGLAASLVASVVGFDAGGPDAYRVLLVLMAVFGILNAGVLALLHDDRPSLRRAALEQRPGDGGLGEPIAARPDRIRSRPASRFGRGLRDPRLFAKLLLPGFLIALGAGQVIPFLNLFVQGKFGLELASLNALFAITSLGTTLAILLQPALAGRFGKIGSVVLVQAASIPFLVVLGFSPVFWTVAVSMAVRNSLMNAGNPILQAFQMEQIDPHERATLSAAASLLWSLGWVLAGPWYSLLQAQLGFEAGYAVNFVTIIALYSAATFLYWFWFRGAERSASGRGPAARPPGG